MTSWFGKRRRRFELETLDHAERKFLSPAYLCHYQVTMPVVQHVAHGKFIDLGCGDLPYFSLVRPLVDTYDALDFTPRSEKVTITADIQQMGGVPAGTYDSAMCLEVLEHVPDPFAAVREIYRILKPGGAAVISVPHISRLHEVPHDYYRFTRYSLAYMFSQAGFTELEIVDRGGLFCFLGHQVSLIVLSLFLGIPVIGAIVRFVNRFLVSLPCFYLDKWLRLDVVFAMGYTLAARKPAKMDGTL